MNIEKGKAMLNSVIGRSRKSPLLNLKKIKTFRKAIDKKQKNIYNKNVKRSDKK